MATRHDPAPGSRLHVRELAQGVYLETSRGLHRVTLYLSVFNRQTDEFRDSSAAEKHANEIAEHYRINVIR